MTTEHIGIYVCVAQHCKRRNVEVEYPWAESWPLAQRQHDCKRCRSRMLFVRLRKQMSDEAKARLRELAAKRKEEV